MARRRRRSDVRGLPRLVRDDVLRLLPRAAAHPRLPDRSRLLVRVALEEREPALAGDVDLGEHDRQLRCVAALGNRAVVPRLRHTDRLGRRLHRQPRWICSARTACSPASPSSRSSRFTARRSSRLRTAGALATVPRPSPGGSRSPPRCSALAYLAWTVAVAMDRNDKDLLPARYSCRGRDRGARARGRLPVRGEDRARVRDDGASATISLVATLFVVAVPARNGLEHRLREQPHRGRRCVVPLRAHR